MKKKVWGLVAGIAVIVLSVALCGCGRKRPVLHIYTWADYVKPELVTAFEQEANCTVVIDTFDSNEAMYAKLKAGATGYDLLFPTSYMVKVLHDEKMIQDLDHRQLQNLSHMDPEYLKKALDPEMTYSVPYMMGTTCLGYLKSKVPNFEPSWSMLDRPELAGRVTMLNDMRETIGAGLKSLGYSLNSRDEKELAEARDVVIRWKKNLAKFENEQYKTGLASGEFFLVHGYSGDLMQVMEDNDDIAIALPKEGAAIGCDDMVIPVDAKEVSLAHRFINYLTDPKVAAENINYIGYVAPNRDAYPMVDEELRSDPAIFPPPEVMAKLEVISDVGDALPIYTRMWDEIKAAQ